MLAAKRLSQNKLMIYLAVLIFLALVVGGYLYWSNSAKQSEADTGSGSFDVTGINSVNKTKFDLKGLEKFDLKIFGDQRFKNLTEFYNTIGIKSSVGRNNPFDPYKKASSTAN